MVSAQLTSTLNDPTMAYAMFTSGVSESRYSFDTLIKEMKDELNMPDYDLGECYDMNLKGRNYRVVSAWEDLGKFIKKLQVSRSGKMRALLIVTEDDENIIVTIADEGVIMKNTSRETFEVVEIFKHP
jgi:hypothetical protein